MSEHADHIVRLERLAHQIEEELHTMQHEKHMVSPDTWSYQSDIEADVRGLKLALKHDAQMN